MKRHEIFNLETANVMRPILTLFGVLKSSGMATMMVLSLIQPSLAIDPQYQPQMQRLLHVVGSLYFLQPLCGFEDQDWRFHAAELIEFDQPTDDRRQRLTGAFNEGYQAYARLYRDCTSSAEQALVRLLSEADNLSRDIHSRFAE